MNQLADKSKALETLIKHSYYLSAEVKEELLQKLPSLTEDAIEKIGTFLALEKKQSLQRGEAFIKILEDIDRAIGENS
jgi:hypothetical protein